MYTMCLNFCGCVIFISIIFFRYMEFLTNWTHAFWPQTGSFHGFPLLPSSSTSCQLGQLTFK